MSTAQQTFEYHTKKFPFFVSVCYLVLFYVSVFGQIQGRQRQRQGIQGKTGGGGDGDRETMAGGRERQRRGKKDRKLRMMRQWEGQTNRHREGRGSDRGGEKETGEGKDRDRGVEIGEGKQRLGMGDKDWGRKRRRQGKREMESRQRKGETKAGKGVDGQGSGETERRLENRDGGRQRQVETETVENRQTGVKETTGWGDGDREGRQWNERPIKG
jgi:hypothetical protein